MKRPNHSKIQSKVKTKVLVSALIVAIGLIGIGTYLFINRHPATVASDSIDTTGWTTYTGPQTGLTLSYPSTAKLRLLVGSAASDTPEKNAVDLQGYIMSFGKGDIDYNYQTAESDVSKSNNLTLTITYNSTNVFYRLDTPTDLQIDYRRTAITLANGQNYDLLQRDDSRSVLLAQCDATNRCSSSIKTDNPRFPYMLVEITMAENSRHDGAGIDFNSQNYRIAARIIQSLNF